MLAGSMVDADFELASTTGWLDLGIAAFRETPRSQALAELQDRSSKGLQEEAYGPTCMAISAVDDSRV
jgi:hypothetical protein